MCRGQSRSISFAFIRFYIFVRFSLLSHFCHEIRWNTAVDGPFTEISLEEPSNDYQYFPCRIFLLFHSNHHIIADKGPKRQNSGHIWHEQQLEARTNSIRKKYQFLAFYFL